MPRCCPWTCMRNVCPGRGKDPAVSGTASLDGAGVVNLTLSNADPNRALAVTCAIRGRQVTGVTGRVLTASTVNAHNTFDEPEAVHPVPFADVELQDSFSRSNCRPSRSSPWRCQPNPQSAIPNLHSLITNPRSTHHVHWTCRYHKKPICTLAHGTFGRRQTAGWFLVKAPGDQPQPSA